MAIDTSTRLEKVKEHLLNYINSSRLEQGDRLPSEADMAKMLGVSRNTIREAYITLEAEDVIVRRHGVGTFITRSPLIKNSLLDEIMGFPENIRAAGYQFDFELVSVSHVLPSLEISQALQGNSEEALLQVKQVQYADGKPAILIVDTFSSWIDESKFVWDEFDGDMLTFVTNALNIPERHFSSRVLATLVDQEISQLLSLPIGNAVVNIRSLITSTDGRPITYSVVFLNPDNIEFKLTRVYRQR
jgi:GntR family transcriptional regulator